MRAKCFWVAILAAFLIVERTGFAAQVINVVNPSFELDLSGNQNTAERDLSEVLGWVEGLDNGSGVETILHPTDPQRDFTGTGDGLMKAYGMWDVQKAQGDWFYQILDYPMVAGEQYQMTFAYGVSSVDTPVIASFIDGSTMATLASLTVTTSTMRVFSDYVLDLTVPIDASYAGHDLGVKFSIGQRPLPWDGWASVDNVRVVVVPEPSMLLLLGLGAVMMRRRRGCQEPSHSLWIPAFAGTTKRAWG